MELSGNKVNPRVLVIGVFHGDEPQGEFFINEYLKVNKNTNLLMIPRLNSNNKRTNKNGVDLNRNFPTKNWKLIEKGDFYGGDFSASEPETLFVINTIEKFQIKAILTIHAPYKIVNYDGPAEDLANKISNITGYPVEPSIGYPTPGSFGTWAGIEKNIPTITLEVDEKIDVKTLITPMFKVFDLLETY